MKYEISSPIKGWGMEIEKKLIVSLPSAGWKIPSGELRALTWRGMNGVLTSSFTLQTYASQVNNS
jgi:hypothetical protein